MTLLVDFRDTCDTAIPGNVSDSYDGSIGLYNTMSISDRYCDKNLDTVIVFNDTMLHGHGG